MAGGSACPTWFFDPIPGLPRGKRRLVFAVPAAADNAAGPTVTLALVTGTGIVRLGMQVKPDSPAIDNSGPAELYITADGVESNRVQFPIEQ